jgi:hypothetical protein
MASASAELPDDLLLVSDSEKYANFADSDESDDDEAENKDEDATSGTAAGSTASTKETTRSSTSAKMTKEYKFKQCLVYEEAATQYLARINEEIESSTSTLKRQSSTCSDSVDSKTHTSHGKERALAKEEDENGAKQKKEEEKRGKEEKKEKQKDKAKDPKHKKQNIFNHEDSFYRDHNLLGLFLQKTNKILKNVMRMFQGKVTFLADSTAVVGVWVDTHAKTPDTVLLSAHPVLKTAVSMVHTYFETMKDALGELEKGNLQCLQENVTLRTLGLSHIYIHLSAATQQQLLKALNDLLTLSMLYEVPQIVRPAVLPIFRSLDAKYQGTDMLAQLGEHISLLQRSSSSEAIVSFGEKHQILKNAFMYFHSKIIKLRILKVTRKKLWDAVQELKKSSDSVLAGLGIAIESIVKSSKHY